MEKIRQARGNMYEELFIDPDRSGGKYSVPYTPRRECLKMLRSKWAPDIRRRGLEMLVEWYRFETSRRRGKFTAAACDKLIALIQNFARKHSEPGFEAGELLGGQGAESEKSGDYESALKFYRASLRFPLEDAKLRYFRLNNIGFCLNFFRKFDEAEEYLRAAAAMNPGRYNAWKNLGVTLEHQGKYEEAAECYMAAVERGHGEPRSICHLRRLLIRQPELAEKYPDIRDKEEGGPS